MTVYELEISGVAPGLGSAGSRDRSGLCHTSVARRRSKWSCPRVVMPVKVPRPNGVRRDLQAGGKRERTMQRLYDDGVQACVCISIYVNVDVLAQV